MRRREAEVEVETGEERESDSGIFIKEKVEFTSRIYSKLYIR